MKSLEDKLFPDKYGFEGQMGTTQAREVAGSVQPAWVGSRSNEVVPGRVAKMYMPTPGSTGGQVKGCVPLVFPYNQNLGTDDVTPLGWALTDYDTKNPVLIVPIAPVSQVEPVTSAVRDYESDVTAKVSYRKRQTKNKLNIDGVEWLLSGDILGYTADGAQNQGSIYIGSNGQFSSSEGDEIESGISFQESRADAGLVMLRVRTPIIKKP